PCLEDGLRRVIRACDKQRCDKEMNQRVESRRDVRERMIGGKPRCYMHLQLTGGPRLRIGLPALEPTPCTDRRTSWSRVWSEDRLKPSRTAPAARSARHPGSTAPSNRAARSETQFY